MTSKSSATTLEDRFPADEISTENQRGSVGNENTSDEIQRAYDRMKAHRATVAGILQDREGPAMPKALAGACTEIDMESMRPGVYLLLRAGAVVYVGSSICIASRVGNHTADPRKTFDRAVFLRCPAEERLDVEGALIRYFLPKFNGPPPADNGTDDVIVKRLGLPPTNPEFRRLFAMKDELRKARARASIAALARPPKPPRPERPVRQDNVEYRPTTERTEVTYGGLCTTSIFLPRREPPPPPPPRQPQVVSHMPPWHSAFKDALAVQKRKRDQRKAKP